jgi:hypothetical protein
MAHQQRESLVIEADQFMRNRVILYNVSNFNFPDKLDKHVTYIEIANGSITKLKIPQGIHHCFCENLNIEEIECPSSLRELYCKNNKISSLHLPKNLRALECSKKNHTFDM